MTQPASAVLRPERRSKAQERIDARLPAETKAMIEHAAALTGVTTSDFVISRAYEAARHIVHEHEIWAFNRAQSRAFVEALLDPPPPNDALRAAAALYKSQVKRGAD